MNGLPMLPAILVDVAGSALNILFSFLATWYAFRLTRLKPDNFLWGYLFYVTLAISAFAISRAVGHISRELLQVAGRGDIWQAIGPYSGAFNTLFMISVAAVMIFYHKGVQAYEAIEQEAAKLKQSKMRLAQAARELKELNLNLEEKVEERTGELSKSEKKFRHLFTASKDMVFFTDNRQNIVDMNSSGYEMLGYSQLESIRLETPGLQVAPHVQQGKTLLADLGLVADRVHPHEDLGFIHGDAVLVGQQRGGGGRTAAEIVLLGHGGLEPRLLQAGDAHAEVAAMRHAHVHLAGRRRQDSGQRQGHAQNQGCEPGHRCVPVMEPRARRIARSPPSRSGSARCCRCSG